MDKGYLLLCLDILGGERRCGDNTALYRSENRTAREKGGFKFQ